MPDEKLIYQYDAKCSAMGDQSRIPRKLPVMIALCHDGNTVTAPVDRRPRRDGMKSIETTKTRDRKRAPLKQRSGSDDCRMRPGLTAKEMRLLRGSFALIEPKAGIAGLVFYRQLFTLDLSLRELFQTSIELQGRKLMESLSYTVATFENPEI